MLLTTLTTTLLSTTALAAALPTVNSPSKTLSRRACTTQYPSHLFEIIQDAPTTNTGDQSYVFAIQSTGKTSQYVMELQFNGIPVGAYGCSVEYFFQRGWPVDVVGENTRLDFFTPDRNLSIADTWNNRAGKTTLVGTAVVSGYSAQDKKVTVVSGACAQTLNYLVEIQGERAGSVGFSQTGGNGFRLTYNC